MSPPLPDTGRLRRGERTILDEFVHCQRLTLQLKWDRLGAGQPAAVESSTMSLLGLVRHVAKVERGDMSGNLSAGVGGAAPERSLWSYPQCGPGACGGGQSPGSSLSRRA
jgi:hypothetical protein